LRKNTIIVCITLMVSFLISIVCIDIIYAGTLSWGSYGEEVKIVQTKLKNWGYYEGQIDGVFGKKTYQAIVKFQRKNRLIVDGKVGSQTRRALGMPQKTTTGQYNETVKISQKKLKQWGYYIGAVDGIYGPYTYEAVIKFQRKNGLKVDGIIGSDTKRALGISEKTDKKAYMATSRGVSTKDDINLLAMAIYGESRGEPYTGQVAVGAVILNRVKHPSFPNSIAGAIFQPGAFTAVDDGQIYLRPNEQAYKAAKDAMNGWDPTGGAIYYWNPAKATSKWIWTREVTLKIGKHWFAHE
jgi:spore cortex-lytic enzyme